MRLQVFSAALTTIRIFVVVTGANVMARGLVGTRLVDGEEVPTLASPLHKQVYDLRTGACLDAAGKEPLPGEGGLRTWPVAVVDGVVTNPLAHAVATALWVGGARSGTDIAYVNTDLWRANPIEADDTSSLRAVGTDGTRYGFGLTLCAAERKPARVIVQGTDG